jgi:hypothetical protein
MSYSEQQPLQGTTKLHGLVGSQFNGVSIDAIKGQIHTETGAAIALGNTPEWGHTKAAEVPEAGERAELTDNLIRQHRPEAFAGKISHFVAHKVDVLMRRGVGATAESIREVGVGPAVGAGDNRHAMIAERSEEAGCRMAEVFDVGCNVTGAPGGGDVGSPGSGGLQAKHR